MICKGKLKGPKAFFQHHSVMNRLTWLTLNANISIPHAHPLPFSISHLELWHANPCCLSDTILLCFTVDLVWYVQYSSDFIFFGLFFDTGNGRLDSIPFNIRAAVLHSYTFPQPKYQGLESNALQIKSVAFLPHPPPHPPRFVSYFVIHFYYAFPFLKKSSVFFIYKSIIKYMLLHTPHTHIQM